MLGIGPASARRVLFLGKHHEGALLCSLRPAPTLTSARYEAQAKLILLSMNTIYSSKRRMMLSSAVASAREPAPHRTSLSLNNGGSRSAATPH